MQQQQQFLSCGPATARESGFGYFALPLHSFTLQMHYYESCKDSPGDLRVIGIPEAFLASPVGMCSIQKGHALAFSVQCLSVCVNYT